jgi:Cu/Ag efflux protein CusF
VHRISRPREKTSLRGPVAENCEIKQAESRRCNSAEGKKNMTSNPVATLIIILSLAAAPALMVVVGAILAGPALWRAAMPATAVAREALIEGQVMEIDASAGKVTLKHGPIEKLGMEQGMTMVFMAQDSAMLEAIKAGDRVEFDADQINGQFT